MNREKFLAKHDPVWDDLPEKWYQALFAGNGMLGILVYKDGPQTVGIDVGRGDVENHRKADQWHDHPRLRIGYFTLDTVGAIQAGQTRLDLWNAEARLKGVKAAVLKNLGNGIVELSLRKRDEGFLYPGNIWPRN